MSMPTELAGPDFSSRFRIIDVRDLDGDQLLASPDMAQYNCDPYPSAGLCGSGSRDRRQGREFAGERAACCGATIGHSRGAAEVGTNTEGGNGKDAAHH